MLETPEHASDRLLKPGEVRVLYGIASSTLRLWAVTGVLAPAQRTAGGHRRFRESDVRALLTELAKVA